MTSAAELGANYRRIQEQVRDQLQGQVRPAPAGRPGGVTLIAVSKKQPPEAIEILYQLGHRDFGENYAQELIDKAEALESRGCTGIRWHFIGHLQTNKVKAIAPVVFAIHSVDSERLARELSKRRPGPRALRVFVEVNVDGEASKSGVSPQAVPALVEVICGLPNLELQGLMCIPAASPDPTPAFARLRELEARCQPLGSRGQLSMGMSSDFTLAIGAGATHVRVGTSLFGHRAAR